MYIRMYVCRGGGQFVNIFFVFAKHLLSITSHAIAVVISSSLVGYRYYYSWLFVIIKVHAPSAATEPPHLA